MSNILLATETKGIVEILIGLYEDSGLASIEITSLIMIGIACVLLYLAIVRGFEPLLLLPIAFGMFLINIPGSKEILFAAPDPTIGEKGGLLYFLYQGVDLVIYPPLIFLGIGAMTDFGPMIANPKSMLLGAAAQVGIFVTFIGGLLLGDLITPLISADVLPNGFDALAAVAYKVLGKYIENLCKNDMYLGKDGKHADDIMSEIQIRLIKKSVSGFFMRDGVPNYSREEFIKWLFTVAKNVKRDYAERVRREEFKKNKLLQQETENKITVSNSAYDRLRSAFEAVVTSDSKVYKVLTWLTVMIIIGRQNVSKIEATDTLVKILGRIFCIYAEILSLPDIVPR